jgi:hypothetical protein
MKATIKNTLVVNNLKSFRDMHGAIPIYYDLAIKHLDSIRGLCSGDFTAQQEAADEQFGDERQFTQLHLRKA